LNFLNDVITYVRRIVKTPSNASLSDNLIIDYINRFYLMDVDARMQLFDLKTKYVFTCVPGVTKYNMPLYKTYPYPSPNEPGGQEISYYPVYQGFFMPTFVNGIQMPFYTQREAFYNLWPLYLQTLVASGTGDGMTTSFTLSLPFFPAIPGHVDITGIISSGSLIDPIVGATLNDPAVVDAPVPITSLIPGVFITALGNDNQTMVITDSGQFSSANQQVGFLQYSGSSPPYTPVQAGTVNYSDGTISVTFPSPPAAQAQINTQCYFFQAGIPRAILFYNNVLEILPPPNVPYVIELGAYLSPAAFISSSAALPFAYMAEYLARGAARKILSDTEDVEQFTFYEPLFKEQEMLVWKRSQRIFTATRTGTIFSDLQAQSGYNNIGQGAAT
jgi:hypothetical protein